MGSPSFRGFLGAQTVMFPASVETDQYLVCEASGKATVFDRNWKELQSVAPEGGLEVPSGESRIGFAYDADKGAAPWVRVRLRAAGDAERAQAAR